MSETDPPDPDPRNVSTELFGLDPRKLIACSLETVKSTPMPGQWAPPDSEALARLLPQFQIHGLLGRGGMGAVYKATQINLDRPVAIKVLPAEMAADAEFVERFKREARALARLQHPGIVTVHDSGQTTEGHLYFVMEYVDGTNLREIMRGPGMKPEQALLITGQLCEALQASHDAGFIHRDIKPENVLLTRQGRVKLADFGLARAAVEDEGRGLTGTNVMMGTFAYMAPEQKAGRTDPRADIYALGVMLYEMLTGEVPGGAFAPPSHRIEVDIRIDEVVLKALQMKPEHRYQQPNDMKTDVDRIRDTPPPACPPTPDPTPPAPFRYPSLALALVAVATLGAGAGYLLLSKPALTVTRGNIPVVPADRPANASATRSSPVVNSLGMKFVPVSPDPSTAAPLLFSVWETRVQDFEAFVKATGYQTTARITVTDLPIEPDPGPLSWSNPGFPQSGMHPVVGVSFQDATAFCRWLTMKERALGQLEPGQEYRLPTDREWSTLLGVVEEPGDYPELRQFPDGIFSWGSAWPPPENTENFAGEEQTWARLNGYRDAWAWTAPVGSGKPDAHGLFDVSGNVREFCKDRRSIRSNERGVRGASYVTWMAPGKNGGSRGQIVGLNVNADLQTGFRCLLDHKSPERLAVARKVEAAVANLLARAPTDFAKCRDNTDYLVNDETVTIDLTGTFRWPTDDDLSACFSDLPIQCFHLSGGSLRTFGALKSMPLETLTLNSTDCVSFDALRGMNLKWFHARNSGGDKIASLDAFRGMKLQGFCLSGCRGVSDLSPLRGQPIEVVQLWDCGVKDLSPLRDSPVRLVTLTQTKVQEVECLNWWPRLEDFSGMDYVVEEQLILPALQALCAGRAETAREMSTELDTRFHHAPWLGRNLLLRDLRAGLLDRFAHWADGDRQEVASAIKVRAGHAYLFVGTGMHWRAANVFAEALGGHLVTVTSKEEDEFIRREVMPRSGGAWLGLTSAPGVAEWKWVTGEPFQYDAWDPMSGAGQALRGADQNYACWHPGRTAMYWRDYADFSTRSVIVEWEIANPQDSAKSAQAPRPSPM